jgi:biotin transport system substrate-specific component
MGELLLQARRLAAAEVVGATPARRALLVALFALLTALGAHLAVPLPVGPVPLSMQTAFVLLSGLLLGARLGAAAQALYLAAGLAGMPVFAHGFGGPAVLLGPTGGYLIAFPAAAALAGWVADRSRTSSHVRSLALLAAGAVLGSAAILAGGWAHLTMLGGSAARALAVGVLPFLAGDAAKVVLALVLAAGLKPRFRQLL